MLLHKILSIYAKGVYAPKNQQIEIFTLLYPCKGPPEAAFNRVNPVKFPKGDPI
jgi:hypothetical protein